MQHIETDQFTQWRVIVIVSPAQFASVFYFLCADRVDMHHASY